MEQVPESCPLENCKAKNTTDGRFYVRWGYFVVATRDDLVPRFRCRSCERTFSTQTLRMDYKQRRPDINSKLLRLLISGVGFRQSARILDVDRKTVTRHFLRLAETCRMFHDAIAQQIAGHRNLQFDEMITFETCRLTMPVTMGTLIDADSRFILDQANAPIRPGGKKSKRSRKLIEKHARIFGVRPDESRLCVRRVFVAARDRLAEGATIHLTTDRKTSYGPLAREVFGARLTFHETYSGRASRRPGTTLHPINHTQAMWRDNLSRLRRRSWLASKKRERLEMHGRLFVVYRNYIRPRFNGEKKTPAERLGLTHRPWTFEDVVDWVPRVKVYV